ncbi:MAG: ferredoxin--NADP reductase [Candidatus Latescibacterota bacterium]
MAKDRLNAVIAQRSEIAPGLLVLRVVPVGWELPQFRPGQFAVLGLPGSAPRVPEADPDEVPPDPDKLISRAYSIASSSVSREFLEFYVTLVHSGALTPRLFCLGIGDRLFLGPKITGRFTLDVVPPQVDVVLLGTGTGIAPYMSMVRTLLGREPHRRMVVVHGARHSWDLGYGAELISLARLSKDLVYLPAVTRPEEEPAPWSGLTGRLQQLWTGGVVARALGRRPAPQDTHVLLCGNPAMIAQMEAILQREGFTEHTPRSPGQYHLERYW